MLGESGLHREKSIPLAEAQKFQKEPVAPPRHPTHRQALADQTLRCRTPARQHDAMPLQSPGSVRPAAPVRQKLVASLGSLTRRGRWAESLENLRETPIETKERNQGEKLQCKKPMV